MKMRMRRTKKKNELDKTGSNLKSSGWITHDIAVC